MKDSEFIELLNLYLDHEISAADAARLEAEVQGNVQRRKVYEQYCRMQKACKVLAEDFQTGGAAMPEPARINFQSIPQRTRAGRAYTIGTIAAAAACVAIILVGRSRQQLQEPGTTPPIAITAPAEANPGAVAVASVPAPGAGLARAVSMPEPALEPAARSLEPEHFYLSRNVRSDALQRAAAEQAAAQFAWMERVQLAPIQVRTQPDALRFDAQPASLRTEPRTYGSRQQPGDPQIELTAFRFQR